jgi:hypothetical protein
MGFDRNLLPDASSFYDAQGLKLIGRGKWKTTECRFHGGSDSMRINTATGAFVCMAGCGARGGDVLAYHMASNGLDFVTAAKQMGAWVDDGKSAQNYKPTPLTPRQALEVMAVECNLVAIAASNVAQRVALTQMDLDRLMAAAKRIARLVEMFT